MLPGSNASSPISSETVKPIPARSDRPVTSTQARPSSRSARVNRASNQVEPNTPTDLPTTSPATIPTATGSVRASANPLGPPTVTPAAKNAKIGTASPAENGWTRCSRCSASPRPSWASRRTGTVNASSTPATVACTPDAWTNAQVASASGSRTSAVAVRVWATSPKNASGTRASARYPMCRVSV